MKRLVTTILLVGLIALVGLITLGVRMSSEGPLFAAEDSFDLKDALFRLSAEFKTSMAPRLSRLRLFPRTLNQERGESSPIGKRSMCRRKRRCTSPYRQPGIPMAALPHGLAV